MEVFNAANVSEDVLAWNSELAMSLVVIDVFLGLYIVVGVFGNVLIIYIYNARLKIKIDDRIFILALAAVDIVVCITGPAFSLTRNILPVAFYGDVACKILWFFTKAMNAVSVELVLVIGVERYLKICRPFGVQMNSKAKMVILAVSVIICFIGHTPIFYFYGEIAIINISRNITGHRCGRIHDDNVSPLNDTGYIYLLAIFVLAVGTLGLIVFLYIMIGRRIYRRIKRRAKSIPSKSSEPDPASEVMSTTTENDTSSSKEVNNVRKSNLPSNTSIQKGGNSKRRRTSSVSVKNWREKHRYSLMFLLIAGTCVVTYIPTLIVNLAVNLDSVYFWNYTSPHLRQLYLYFFQVYIVNHVVNPFIYGYFDSAFRTEMKQILCKR